MRITLGIGGGLHRAGIYELPAAARVEVRHPLDLCGAPGGGGSA